ncbi:MAG: cysteine synthase A [Succiniclasticum sp.]|mgnify:CR=1 FL=1|jgi:cysteine synthase A|nr:cysteine synthase A [Succiniclasticum sp.]MCI6222386.1 cysteine synthase A [Selenomonadales bacterium]MDY2869805.1 cysteine synthase A [Succiniclasticum sp.]MDY6303507.1 cysteine synthase A [Succiniclasticum sp.]MDY6346780.1 cysteine synthase A [Succiniclasticum sp.]
MTKIASSITDLIGNTPLLETKNFNKEFANGAKILVKLEYFNPAGSAKDRIAKAMVKDALDSGVIQPGATLIEPTSGNTGIGLAAVAAAWGLKLILTMPETMSLERRNLAKAYGAELVLTPGSLGMKGALDKAAELQKAIPGSWIPSQFTNPSNPKVHEATTGPEIWRDTDGKVDIFVAGVGSGGTVSGVGTYLKKQNADVKVVAVEPADSPMLSAGHAGPHKIQGIGANFVPDNFRRDVVDEILTIQSDDAFRTTQALARTEGVLTGISSGAALHAAVLLAARKENAGKTIVVLLPDTGERYLSTPGFVK